MVERVPIARTLATETRYARNSLIELLAFLLRPVARLTHQAIADAHGIPWRSPRILALDTGTLFLMASRFRTRRDVGSGPASPEDLFRELRPTDRSIRDLLSRQADVLREYQHLDASISDVALELPTGAGKTLVGLLLADFRRRTRSERAAYLCPNIQLARQVARKGLGYGLPVVCLTGPQRKYDASDWNAYVRGKSVAVTTYSAVFNTNPKIGDAETLVLDDAHAGEGYVADLWSVSATRDESPFAPVVAALSSGLPRGLAERLRDDNRGSYGEALDVELVAPPVVYENADLLREALAAHAGDPDDPNHWAARMLEGQVEHCLVYVSFREILIRPLIPPTALHRPFSAAVQRIYMSATLGAGGELERAFGIPAIHRLPVPSGAERQGLGRRFFLFPSSSRSTAKTDEFVRDAINEAGRALVIAPSNRQLETFSAECLPAGMTTVDAQAVQDGFGAFVAHTRAALLLANRYDGMDLPDDACRLVVLTGLPAYSHLQERFLLDRLLAGRVIAERVRTRITQGAGRCTRNAKDYAAVIVHGDRLVDFCSRDEEIASMLPELQAEIEFGLENSEANIDLLDLLRLFLKQGQEWMGADDAIRADTAAMKRVLAPGVENLQRSVGSEVQAWQAIWKGDVDKAISLAQAAADELDGVEELRGYRVLWMYLAASWAGELTAKGDSEIANAAALRSDVEGAARMLPWYPRFKAGSTRAAGSEYDARAARAASVLRRLGIRGTKFETKMRELEERLSANDATPFELGVETLGELLGFESLRRADTAAPDGAWRDGDAIWFVFEAKTEEKPTNPISATEVRQALSHPTWVSSNFGWEEPKETVNTIITYKGKVEPAAASIAERLFVVNPDVLRDLGQRTITVYRQVRGRARGLADEALAGEFATGFSNTGLTTASLQGKLGRILVAKL